MIIEILYGTELIRKIVPIVSLCVKRGRFVHVKFARRHTNLAVMYILQNKMVSEQLNVEKVKHETMKTLYENVHTILMSMYDW